MPVILATEKVEVGGLRSKTSLDRRVRLYLKNKLKYTGLGMWLKLLSFCLVSLRPLCHSSPAHTQNVIVESEANAM
jgi:hypothetical protein